MNINLNEKLLTLVDAYHAGKLSKEDYRAQRAIEFERLNALSEESDRKPPVFSVKVKKHIMVSVVLFVVLISIIAVMFV